LSKNLRFSCLLTIIFVLIGINIIGVWAQPQYPTKPIEIVIPYDPGGGSDISSRTLAKHAEKYFGQPWVIKNISGGGGVVGCSEVLNSKPDGYTLLWHHTSMNLQYHTGASDFTWDAFTPICMAIGMMNNVLIVKEDAPWDSINEMVDFALENPGEVKLGCAIGSSNHLAMAMLDQSLGGGIFKFVFTGGGDSEQLAKLLGGFSDCTGISIPQAEDNQEAGKVNILATIGSERSKFLPEVPTLIESGYDAVVDKDFTIYGPPDLPEDIVKIISENVKKLTEDEELVNDLAKIKMEAIYHDTEETRERLLAEDVKFYKLTRILGLKQ